MSKLFAAISPAPSGWSISKDHCTWTNVECAKSTGSVVSINLDSQSISGEIPSELKHLTSLRSLSVQNNFLSGRLPSFANMSNLEQLYLDNNKFSSIPSGFLLGVPNLKTFSISENGNLGPWQIPSYLIESTNLNVFHASNASITGAIPNFFDSFPNLQNLRLSYNNLTGSLPWSIGRSKIQNLWLDNQKQGLSGTIDVISSMTQLSQVWLQANAFTGPIPDLSKCVNLFDLQLRDNELTGVVPVSLTGHPNLENITLQNNKLQGPMPLFGNRVKATLGDTNSFCMDTPGPCDPQVTALLAIAGGLGYPITLAQSWKGNDACQNWAFITCDSLVKNVTTVNLGNLRFSGTISPNFSKLTSLRNLYLNDNNLTGPVPENLTTLPNLQVLDVSNNNLSGPIPSFPPAVKISIHGNLFLGKNVSSSDPGNGGSPDTVLNSNGYALTVGLAAKTIILFFAFFVLKSLTVLVCYKCHAWRKGLFVKVARKSNNQTLSSFLSHHTSNAPLQLTSFNNAFFISFHSHPNFPNILNELRVANLVTPQWEGHNWHPQNQTFYRRIPSACGEDNPSKRSALLSLGLDKASHVFRPSSLDGIVQVAEPIRSAFVAVIVAIGKGSEIYAGYRRASRYAADSEESG
nr:receptor-like kinase TMK4 [Ipomoea batatas]